MTAVTTTSPWADPGDRRRVLGATGLLARFNHPEVLAAADVHVAQRLGSLAEETDDEVLLAVALAVRAVRTGSVCLDLATIGALPLEDDLELPWPEPTAWTAAVGRSALVAQQLLRLDGTRLYLDRYWREEGQVCDDLVARVRRDPPEVDAALLEAGLERVFPGEGYAEQRDAARGAAVRWTTVLTGGPGTGKTTTVAGLLTLVAEQHELLTGRPPRMALSAPTGKAAARLQEAVQEATERLSPGDQQRLGVLHASTLHRLLGWRPDSRVRFRHHRGNRLPHDVVVVDETSMVSLTMMARLLEAMRPDARLVLVGDPDQLASVEAGAVLADLVAGLEDSESSPVAALRRTHRFGARIGALADALRTGDGDAALAQLRAGGGEVELVDAADEAAMTRFRDEVADVAVELRRTGEAGDRSGALAALGGHRLLCAHREGPYGVGGWNRLVERLVAERTGVTHYDEWYAGRPILVTANDYDQLLNNGDMGATVRDGDGRLRVVVQVGGATRELATSRLAGVETVHAMTVHKSQGSQARVVSVVLPDEQSRLLTRELFYTAVTRAQERVRVVGTEAAVRAAVSREVQRASGLRERLRAALAEPPSGGVTLRE
ncbi:DNA helicase/exodeoxyribonuclease V, alpha subunit [Nocardioides scoriae]|uniref:RecBCD enzyme subunit RecD n=1 Tax=Nocardioides scoriae TaxID=642780 RepID=A0A1H1W4R0_9ACTN|nr:exodeoxyribonuclease V subunit alpha [Nocardioides scoriae]SDS91651.1 DNA helicase/exodeoxyribonuclease V, alpha subunit [Nocardioides scoriae]